MTLQTVPHLNFRGQARAALEHYRAAFGGELTAITYGQMGTAETPEEADLVVWGQVASPSGQKVMARDPFGVTWVLDLAAT